MRNDGGDELRVEAGNHAWVIRAVNRRDFQIDGEHNQKDDGGAEGRDRADEQAGRHERLVPYAALVGREGAQQVAQDPAHQDGRQLQRHSPPDAAADDIRNGSGILVVADAEGALGRVADEIPELAEDILVQAELVLVEGDLLLHLFGGGSGADALAHDGVDRIAGHQTRQDEVQDDRRDKRDDKPDDLLLEVLF